MRSPRVSAVTEGIFFTFGFFVFLPIPNGFESKPPPVMKKVDSCFFLIYFSDVKPTFVGEVGSPVIMVGLLECARLSFGLATEMLD